MAEFDDSDNDTQGEEELNEELFVKDGQPLRIHLHRSIRLPGARTALKVKIETRGGVILDKDAGSNVILVDPMNPMGLDSIRHAYKTHSNPLLKGVHVESMTWVNNCIKNGKCVHQVAQKRISGRTGHNGVRNSFTKEDDRHLVHYLATLIPDKADGGRNGNEIYKRLIRNASVLPEEYAWVHRHTWQSWRERYKTKQDYFDPRIAKAAKKLDPAPHQMYEYSRKVRKGSRRVHLGLEDGDEVFGSEDEDEDEEQGRHEDEEQNEEQQQERHEEEEEPAQKKVERYEEEEEEEEEEDVPAAADPRKRRISGSSRSNVKRPRTSRSRSPVQEQAPDEDYGDGHYSDNSLFGDHDLPAPEVHLPSQQARSSQATLLGTAPLLEKSLPDPEPEHPRQTSPPRSKKRVVRPTAPRPAAAPAPRVSPEVEAPRRGTRSRSQPLEPQVDDVDAVMRKRRQEKRRALEPVEERPASTMESQEVEDLLFNERSGISDKVPEAELMPPPRRQGTRQRSTDLDTDDGRSKRTVAFSPFAHSSAASHLGRQQLENVRRSIGLSPSHTSASRTVPLDNVSNTASIDQQSLFSPASRRGSGSSAESFPLEGTRARAKKHDLQDREKRTPYRPPPGTRAAQFAPGPS